VLSSSGVYARAMGAHLDFLINQVLVKAMFFGVPLILLGGYFRKWFGAQAKARLASYLLALIIIAVEAWLTIPSPDFALVNLTLTVVIAVSAAHFGVPRSAPRVDPYGGGGTGGGGSDF